MSCAVYVPELHVLRSGKALSTRFGVQLGPFANQQKHVQGILGSQTYPCCPLVESRLAARRPQGSELRVRNIRSTNIEHQHHSSDSLDSRSVEVRLVSLHTVHWRLNLDNSGLQKPGRKTHYHLTFCSRFPTSFSVLYQSSCYRFFERVLRITLNC